MKVYYEIDKPLILFYSLLTAVLTFLVMAAFIAAESPLPMFGAL